MGILYLKKKKITIEFDIFWVLSFGKNFQKKDTSSQK